MAKVRAFQTRIPSLGGDGGIVLDVSASKARYSAFLGASDCWPGIKLIEVQVSRAPEYDRAVMVGGQRLKKGRCYGKDYILKEGDQ